MRDRALGSTVRLMFNTTNPSAGGAPVAPSSAFAAADIRIYKDGSATEKTSTNGITVTSPFDSVVGLHLVEIDTSNSTGDVGFWSSGSVYQVRLVTAKTVATYSVSGLPIGEFSLEVQTADVRKFGGTAGTFSSGRPEVRTASVADNALTAAALATDAVTEIQNGLATQSSVDAIQADTNDIQARLPAALDGGRIAAVLDSAGRLAIWNVLLTESFTADSMGARLLISDGTNGRQVKVTGAKHVAADVHECQADGLSASTEITAINTFATRVTTGLVSDGPVWQFTANMLELAPSGTGVDELLALQEEILDAINGYISGLTAVAVESPGSITGFPESLRIGDSYTDVLGRGIQIPIVDVNGNPISSVGSKNFADAQATFVIKRFSDTEPLRIINGTALFVDPPGTGTSAGETPYALIEIPSSETAKGLVKYKYTGLLTFTWPYVGTGTDAEVMTFETGTITFET